MIPKEILLDVSELEAPHPLVKGIAAMKDLKEDETLIFIHRMFPCKLQEQIDAWGCTQRLSKMKKIILR